MKNKKKHKIVYEWSSRFVDTKYRLVRLFVSMGPPKYVLEIKDKNILGEPTGWYKAKKKDVLPALIELAEKFEK